MALTNTGNEFAVSSSECHRGCCWNNFNVCGLYRVCQCHRPDKAQRAANRIADETREQWADLLAGRGEPIW